MVLVSFLCVSAEAGWLGDKLKKAADSVGNNIINDVADGVYKGSKDVMTPGGDEAAQGEGVEPAETGEAAKHAGQGTEFAEQEDAYLKESEYEDGYPERPEYEGEYDERLEYEGEYAEEQEFEAMGGQAWGGGPDFAAPSRKKRKKGPPRTDLYFSAEMIMDDPEAEEVMKGRLYIDGTRIRTDLTSDLGMIVTGVEASDKVYVLLHKEKTYIESSNEDSEAFFIEDVKPCEGYANAEKLGRTKLNGRSAVKWHCTAPEDPDYPVTTTLWFDEKLNFPLRSEGGKGEGSWELANIREGKPPADLFRIPPDYKKMAAGGMPTADSLPAEDANLIKGAGVPLYSRARFVYGNPDVGYRFASAEPVEKVQAWYRDKLSSWSVYQDKFGSWIIYNGEPGANMSQLVLQKTQVSVRKNEELPQWHSLEEDVTTEIVIFIDR
jgi:hypothetical protein